MLIHFVGLSELGEGVDLLLLEPPGFDIGNGFFAASLVRRMDVDASGQIKE